MYTTIQKFGVSIFINTSIQQGYIRLFKSDLVIYNFTKDFYFK